VKTDIDGQPRKRKADAGCDEISSSFHRNRPLAPADVGPFWLESKRTTRN
jgi:poly(beta-D-mannuronate) lyase